MKIRIKVLAEIEEDCLYRVGEDCVFDDESFTEDMQYLCGKLYDVETDDDGWCEIDGWSIFPDIYEEVK